jgi:hypothetical protein
VTRVATLEHLSILRCLTSRHDDLNRHHPVGMKALRLEDAPTVFV